MGYKRTTGGILVVMEIFLSWLLMSISDYNLVLQCCEILPLRELCKEYFEFCFISYKILGFLGGAAV